VKQVLLNILVVVGVLALAAGLLAAASALAVVTAR
jgi:hypothetical protein